MLNRCFKCLNNMREVFRPSDRGSGGFLFTKLVVSGCILDWEQMFVIFLLFRVHTLYDKRGGSGVQSLVGTS